MSNEDRRQHGLDVIAAYERLPGVETRDDGAPLVQVVTDLLTDLRHAVEPNDFAKALRLSEMHHAAELSLELRQ
jgi:hypothetical protein